MTDNSPNDPREKLWRALEDEFGKYGGLQPEDLENWSNDSQNKAPVRLPASTVRGWVKNRTRPTTRERMKTLLMYLESLRPQPHGDAKAQDQQSWWSLWHAAGEGTPPAAAPEHGTHPPAPLQDIGSPDRPSAPAATDPPPPPSPPGPIPRPTAWWRRRRVLVSSSVTLIGVAVAAKVFFGPSDSSGEHSAAAGVTQTPPASSAPGSASPGSTQQPTDAPAKLCAHVLGDGDPPVHVYPVPNAHSKPVKTKEPLAPITVLPILTNNLHAPAGWLVVSTPADTIKHRWMKASDLSTPGPCPDPLARPAPGG